MASYALTLSSPLFHADIYKHTDKVRKKQLLLP